MYEWIGDHKATDLLGLDWEVLNVLENHDLKRFHCGKWEFVMNDMEKVMGPEFAKDVADACFARVAKVFMVRDNMVNLKKVYLHLYYYAKEVDRHLSKFTVMFFGDGANWMEYLAEQISEEHLECIKNPCIDNLSRKDIYITSSVALQKCRGLLGALEDCRMLLKRLCCVPRHPMSSFTPFYKMLNMLRMTKCLKDLEIALPTLVSEPLKLDVDKPSQDIALEVLDEWLLDVSEKLSLDDGTRLFLKKVFIARGVAKALHIEIELDRIVKCLTMYCERMQLCESSFQAFVEESRRNGSANEILIHKMNRNHHNIAIGRLVYEELIAWAREVQTRDNELLFVACDRGDSAALFLPEGFNVAKTHFQSLQSTIDLINPELERILLETDGKIMPRGRFECKRCDAQLCKPWINPENGLCHVCELSVRTMVDKTSLNDSGLMKCPLQMRCIKTCSKMHTLCPHSLKCFVCDTWTCYDCRILRCDGEDTLSLFNEFKPTTLLLDFDKTLASTKNGQSPFNVGKQRGMHSIDSNLRDAAMACKDTHVVTRNRHTEHIAVFLKQHGLGHVQVHSVQRIDEVSNKSEIISTLLKDSKRALFCDDSCQEILDPSLRRLVTSTGTLLTVLYARGY